MKKSLVIILVCAFLVRFIGISSHPVGFTPDEASFGYDSYSLLKTGHDQWGHSFPLSFKSFGDYKLPLYSYLSMPIIAAFGLSIFSTRLLSVLIGTLAVWATYLFVKRYFENEKLALLSALVLALSPWHIALSRGAFEANLTAFFLPFGLWAISDKNKKIQFLGALALGLNLFSYHTARFLTVPILFVWGLFNRKLVKNVDKKAWGIFLIFVILVAFSILGGAGGRLATSNIFSLQNNIFNDRVGYIKAGEPEIIAKLFNNKITFLSTKFINNYLEYLSPQFLFLEGAREATYGMVPGVGVIYLFNILFLPYALYIAVKKRDSKIYFVLVWILMSVVPAALSLGPGLAANRAAFMMPALQILSAYGGYQIYKLLDKKYTKKILIAFLVVMAVSCTFFAEDYWYREPVVGRKAMISQTEELFSYLDQVQSQYSRIIVTKKISEPHIFPAFYFKLDPRQVQSASQTWQYELLGVNWVDQQPEYDLGKFTFRNIDWQRDMHVEDALLIGTPEEFPENVKILKAINYSNGEPAYYIVDTRTHVFAYEK